MDYRGAVAAAPVSTSGEANGDDGRAWIVGRRP